MTDAFDRHRAILHSSDRRYGFGLFGRMGSAPAASIGIALYTGQLFFSRIWLRRYGSKSAI